VSLVSTVDLLNSSKAKVPSDKAKANTKVLSRKAKVKDLNSVPQATPRPSLTSMHLMRIELQHRANPVHLYNGIEIE